MEKPRSPFRERVRAYISGAASILDFSGTLKPRNPYEGLPPDVADHLAIKSDWATVGKDIQSAINTVRSEDRPQK